MGNISSLGVFIEKRYHYEFFRHSICGYTLSIKFELDYSTYNSEIYNRTDKNGNTYKQTKTNANTETDTLNQYRIGLSNDNSKTENRSIIIVI